MDSKEMSRKDFITLTFTLIGTGAAIGACSSSNNNGGTAGNNGTSGTNGAAGTTGFGGHAGNGLGGHAGTNGAAGSAGTTGAGGSGTSACTNPLPETQDADGLGHVHTLDVPASLLDATSDQTLTTGAAAAAGGASHMHTVMLTVANLATLKGGGTVDVPSGITLSHMHSYTVSCH